MGKHLLHSALLALVKGALRYLQLAFMRHLNTCIAQTQMGITKDLTDAQQN